MWFDLVLFCPSFDVKTENGHNMKTVCLCVRVQVLFELARYHAPSTIFLDELESVIGQRGHSSGRVLARARTNNQTHHLPQATG